MLFLGFGGGAGKGPGIGRPIRHFDRLIDLGNSCKTRTLLVALSLACLEMSFVVKGVILLFRLKYKTSVVCHNVYSYFEKNVHATIPQGNMGYDQYTVPDD